MSKYTRFDRRLPPPDRPWRIHPIWRGIGCLLLLLLPPISYATGVILVGMNMQNGWLEVSPEIMQTVKIPWLGSVVPHLYANLMAGVVVLVLGIAVLMFIYSIVYSILGPPRYSPVDAPPERPRFKKRR